MARTKIPVEFSSTPGIVDDSSATAITIDSAGAATFSNAVDISATIHPVSLARSGDIAGHIELKTAGVIRSYLGASSTSLFTVSNGAGGAKLNLDSSGNLGIAGQTSPTYKLDGGFADQTWGWYLNDSYNAGMTYNTAERSLLIHTKSAENIDHIKFATSSTGAEAMRIDASGNVGIGGNPIGGARLGLSKSAGGDVFVLTDTTTADLIVNCTGGVTTIKSSTGILALGTGNAEKLRIDANGNLGIGTSAAGISTNGLKTVIHGATGYPATSGTTQTGVLRLSGGAGLYNSLDMGVNEATDSSWIQATRANSLGTYDKLLLNPYGGNVGIGTSSPRVTANVIGLTIGNSTTGGSELVLRENTGNDWRIFNNGYLGFIDDTTERMRIDASGNLSLMTDGAAIKLFYTEARPFISNSGASVTIKQIDNSATNAYIDFTSWTDTSLMRLTNSGNVGIGGTASHLLAITGLNALGANTSQQAYDNARFRITHLNNGSSLGVHLGYTGANSTYIQGGYNEGTTAPLALNPFGGNVGIGTSTPATKLTIDAPAADRETIRLATYYSPIDNLARGGISWHDGGAVTGQIDTRYTGTTVDMHLGHLYNSGYNTTSRVIIKGNGNVEIPDGNLSFAAGHGIDFSATANAGGTSNATGSELLDDYEEGTWYPYLGTETQLGGASSSNSNNKYVKIGRLVHCTGWFPSWDWANVTSGSYIMIRNLPFAPEHHSTGLKVSYASNLGSSTYGYGHTGLSAFYLLIGGSTGAPAHFGRAAAPTSGTAHAMLSITYYTAS